MFRLHGNVAADFTPGRAHVTDLRQPKRRWVCGLGKKDQIVERYRPHSKPQWMSREDFEALPTSFLVREIQYRISQPGYRTRSITLVTTLLDAKRDPAKKLAELYHMRWEIETAFDHLKTTMRMDILRSKTVDGIKKELPAYFIVYNLVRLVMMQAGGASAKLIRLGLNLISLLQAGLPGLPAQCSSIVHSLHVLNRLQPGLQHPCSHLEA